MAIWLLKTEPQNYSWADLERDGETMWDGVSQPHALCNIRKIESGDLALIYHTGDERAIIGTAHVTRGFYVNPEGDDARLAVCDLRVGGKLARRVSLKEIKAQPELQDWDLVRLARLSVVAVSEEQWRTVRKLAEVKE